MKEIQLTQGKVALVDDEDFEQLNKFKWCAKKAYNTYYAMRASRSENGKVTTRLMHRDLMNSKLIDHLNHNGLDNRKNNLRPCTNQQNNRNQRKGTNSSSKYKGVSMCKSRNTWQASIVIDKTLLFLGRFKDEIDAAIAYNKKAKELFGEFACLNNI